MALPALAEIDAFASRLGTTTSQLDTPRAYAALDDASTLVRVEVGQSWVDDAGALGVVPEIARMVVLSVARRAYENPSGLISRSIGTYREQWSSGGTPAPAVALTAYERGMLSRLRDVGGLYTIATTRRSTADWTPIANASPPGTWVP